MGLRLSGHWSITCYNPGSCYAHQGDMLMGVSILGISAEADCSGIWVSSGERPNGNGCQYIWLNGDNQACIDPEDCKNGIETSYGVGGNGSQRLSDIQDGNMNGGLPGCQGAHNNCSSDKNKEQCEASVDKGCYWKGVYAYLGEA